MIYRLSGNENASFLTVIGSFSVRYRRPILISGLLFSIVFSTAAYGKSRSGRGATLAQDREKLGTGPLASSRVGGACHDIAEGSTALAPADLVNQNGVLEVTLNLQTDVDATGRQRYCYVTSTGLVSPTLRVNPGDTLLIHFDNQLPAGLAPVVPEVMPNMASMTSVSAKGVAAGMQVTLHDSSASDSDSSPCSGGAMSASASNLHFHGLNVSPTCYSDEVVNTLVQPGQEFDYSVQIPRNEPSGLYWYHPHPHGFGEGQVRGGATGAIIVEGIQQADTSLVGLLLFAVPGNKRRRNNLLVLLSFSLLCFSIGCSGGAATTDAGTPKGNYVVVVTGNSGTGSSQIQTTVNVPITIQ